MFRRDQSIVLYNGDNARGHGCLIARGEGGREGGGNKLKRYCYPTVFTPCIQRCPLKFEMTRIG